LKQKVSSHCTLRKGRRRGRGRREEEEEKEEEEEEKNQTLKMPLFRDPGHALCSCFPLLE
jgi:hypothetical protein